MDELAEQLTRVVPAEDGPDTFPNVRPRDAATLVLIDRTRSEPHVLVGRRHGRHAFMAGKFVFPGGRIEPSDARMRCVGALDAASERRLLHGMRSKSKARLLALAAVRETFEETGLVVGRRDREAVEPSACPPDWRPFAEAGVAPDLSMLTFVARAVTPPRRPRRFDTRFFIADRADVAADLGDPTGPDSEFVEMKWLPLAVARESGDMPTISKIMLVEIERRLATRGNPPVPYYISRGGRFHRLELD